MLSPVGSSVTESAIVFTIVAFSFVMFPWRDLLPWPEFRVDVFLNIISAAAFEGLLERSNVPLCFVLRPSIMKEFLNLLY